MPDQLYVLAVLLVSVFAAHWLGQTRFGRPVGGAIIVIVLMAVLSNVGVVPTASEELPLYPVLISVAAPLSIFLLLLNVRITALREAGWGMLLLFTLGAVGTFGGVWIAGIMTGSEQWLGEWHGPLSGMFTATYIGGGANFHALALHYEFLQTGNLFVAATVVDHVMSVVWITALLALPMLIRPFLKRLSASPSEEAMEAPSPRADSLELFDLAALLAMALTAHWISLQCAKWLGNIGINVPSILILTTLGLLMAQLKPVQRLRGSQLLGMYGAYLFLGVLGAYCELGALFDMGQTGFLLLIFVAIALTVHLTVLVVGGLSMRQSPEAIAVASAANVGGATVVLPLVQSFRRLDLLLPGVLIGSLGNAVGTYLGFLMVRLL